MPRCPWTTTHDTCSYRSSICIAVPLGRASEVNNTHHVKKFGGHIYQVIPHTPQYAFKLIQQALSYEGMFSPRGS